LKKVIQKLLLENGTPWKYGVFSDISRYWATNADTCHNDVVTNPLLSTQLRQMYLQ
jgi:hypothetical protein